MPIPVYNEQAQRYLQPGSSKFMGTKEAEAMIAAEKGGNGNGNGNGKQSSLGSIAAPIVASLRQEFKGLNKHLAFRFEDIKKAIIGGSPAEKRDLAIKEEDVKPVVAPVEGETGGSKGSLSLIHI